MAGSSWRGSGLTAAYRANSWTRRLPCQRANHFRSFRGHVTRPLVPVSRKFVDVGRSARTDFASMVCVCVCVCARAWCVWFCDGRTNFGRHQSKGCCVVQMKGWLHYLHHEPISPHVNSASKMTYVVSVGLLNSSNSLTHSPRVTIFRPFVIPFPPLFRPRQNIVQLHWRAKKIAKTQGGNHREYG